MSMHRLRNVPLPFNSPSRHALVVEQLRRALARVGVQEILGDGRS
jgi:hypothetical protein